MLIMSVRLAQIQVVKGVPLPAPSQERFLLGVYRLISWQQVGHLAC